MADNDDVLAVTANTAGKAAFKNEAKNRQQYARPMTDKISWRSQIPLSKYGKRRICTKRAGSQNTGNPLFCWYGDRGTRTHGLLHVRQAL